MPEPVFAQKMVGDGISTDPTDALLLAYCDGEVISRPAAGDVVTLRTAHGVDVLMLVGTDTVNLRGEGFQPSVKPGDQVGAGSHLIAFELDYLATRAKRVLTQAVIPTARGSDRGNARADSWPQGRMRY